MPFDDVTVNPGVRFVITNVAWAPAEAVAAGAFTPDETPVSALAPTAQFTVNEAPETPFRMTGCPAGDVLG